VGSNITPVDVLMDVPVQVVSFPNPVFEPLITRLGVTEPVAELKLPYTRTWLYPEFPTAV
jgi:hypothetical protein